LTFQGTGKSFTSAFALRDMKAKKALFLVHKEQIAKPEIHKQFLKEEFDVIVVDKVHHVAAESYQMITNYFESKFWMGMTASPDTNNYDIYSILTTRLLMRYVCSRHWKRICF
jgi:superfamily II DNA or RNA helicase